MSAVSRAEEAKHLKKLHFTFADVSKCKKWRFLTDNMIFISYRRTAQSSAGRVRDHLRRGIEESDIFKDVDVLTPGNDFTDGIAQAIKSTKVMLVIVHPDFTTSLRDLSANPLDFVRIEIKSALKYHIPIIPVLVDGADVPRATDLPFEIQKLSFSGAALLRGDPYFENDCADLVETCKYFLSKDLPERELDPEILQLKDRTDLHIVQNFLPTTASSVKEGFDISPKVKEEVDSSMRTEKRNSSIACYILLIISIFFLTSIALYKISDYRKLLLIIPSLIFFLMYLNLKNYSRRRFNAINNPQQASLCLAEGVSRWSANKSARCLSRPVIKIDPYHKRDSMLECNIPCLGIGDQFYRLAQEGCQNTILVTSLLGFEGKSTIAIGLAIDISSTRTIKNEGLNKVLVIDVNFIRPILHQKLDSMKTPGLSNIILDKNIAFENKLESIKSSAIQRIDGKFDFIPYGSAAPLNIYTSGEISYWIREIIKNLDYDFFVIDCPPLNVREISLANFINDLNPLVFLVNSPSYNTKNGLVHLIESLGQENCVIAGILINKMIKSRWGRFFPQYHSGNNNEDYMSYDYYEFD